ncbi:hypothetical protein [Streptomyces marianii]|uniref:hypothetical protein n=1 Tax=Streptomyces marianii TaxID=1817406 RepID=UPI0018F8C262
MRRSGGLDAVADRWAERQERPEPEAREPGGGTVTFELDKQDPKNPAGDRFTGKRFEKLLNITLNSLVFRSGGQDLTTTGTYIEMTAYWASWSPTVVMPGPRRAPTPPVDADKCEHRSNPTASVY